jgi:hypothetical protein
VVRATFGAIQRAIAEADSPRPGSSTPVGLPEPVQRMFSRCPPTSIRRLPATCASAGSVALRTVS